MSSVSLARSATMKKPHGIRFDAEVVAAVLLLPLASVSALIFGPIPEPSICSIQTVYVRSLPPVPTPVGGGGGGGGYSFNLPDVSEMQDFFISFSFF